MARQGEHQVTEAYEVRAVDRRVLTAPLNPYLDEVHGDGGAVDRLGLPGELGVVVTFHEETGEVRIAGPAGIERRIEVVRPAAVERLEFAVTADRGSGGLHHDRTRTVRVGHGTTVDGFSASQRVTVQYLPTTGEGRYVHGRPPAADPPEQTITSGSVFVELLVGRQPMGAAEVMLRDIRAGSGGTIRRMWLGHSASVGFEF